MTTLRFILGDQLSHNLSALKDADKKNDIIFMCEVWDEATYVRHHKKKLAFVFSAMRHFAEELKTAGYAVVYRRLDEHKAENFTAALRGAVHDYSITKIICCEASEYRVLEAQKKWAGALGINVDIRADDRFVATHEEFAIWAKGRKELRMEYFYRDMRRKTNLLMEGDAPEGGQWNYDKENRVPPKDKMVFPDRPAWPIDDITQDVLKLVKSRFDNHFGDLEPFNYPVTRADALTYLDWFIETALLDFGTFQDAMVEGEALMYHSHLSGLINIGLLDARECCSAAEAAYRARKAPLNAVEGFIRQIIGWREFIRGVYWLKMPDYAEQNVLNASLDLPDWFWTGQTKMNCMRQSILETKENAYAHHIQRLMVIGNFSMLAGLAPAQVQNWFLLVYHDAYEWVEMPNVVGMALYADGGVFASKPYASSGAYIDKMSNYCGKCSYSVAKKNGPKACPFNYLYWNFLMENRDVLAKNQRMGMMYGTLNRMEPAKLDAIRDDSRRFLKDIETA
ncbi:MAG: cryptochrome/photolyase family protein [Ahrensia sp.]|nr:cryptochrome/photolyase family protein [Ahrensia sp.]